MWDIGLCTVIISTVSITITYIIAANLGKYFTRNTLRNSPKNHNWTNVTDEDKAHYCSICEALLLNIDGVLCDFCGICADRGCINRADEEMKCKVMTQPYDQSMKHHWVRGNLALTATCEVCHEECNEEPGLVDWQCCWCQKCVHKACKPTMDEICDYGKFKLMLIPPGSLDMYVTNRPNTVRKRLQLRSIIPPIWPDWKPLIVVANKKSGNNDGRKILSMFRLLLNPAQVVDLSERDPVAALEWCHLLDKTPFNVLVAGGDGTVAWLLNTIEKLHLKVTPAVAILPLGTGNDLSRVMGWGKEYDSSLEASEILRRIQMADPIKLDRWTVSMKSDGRSLGFSSHHRQMFMYNYMSVGVDAQVALNFHRARESRFYLFSHRIFNKLLYLCFGTQQVVERECRDLDKRVEVYLDGRKVDLPASESIVILNIPFWGAGVKLWELGREDNDDVGVQSINDGKLEVCSLYSSFHIAQLQVGLSRPERLGQAQVVKIKLLNSCAVQIDGEPWYQSPCEFTITHCNHALMLKSNSEV